MTNFKMPENRITLTHTHTHTHTLNIVKREYR